MISVIFTGILVLLALVSFALVIMNNPEKADNSYDRKSVRTVRRWATGVGVVALFFGLVVGISSSIYRQDIGESVMTRSVSGKVTGVTTEAGWHTKAPWDSVVRFDIRNNVVSFINAKSESSKSATGTYITVQDRDGAKANIDIVVRYSLKPESVDSIYQNFKTQENFTERVLVQAVRSTVREIPTGYGTMEVLNKRAQIGAEIAISLEDQLEPHGVILEDVDLQEIAYSKEVQDRLDEAQTSRIAVDKAKADLERAKIEADTARATAQGSADANKILESSLTEQVLQQKYIDALKAGTVFVVPEGSTPMISTK